LLKRLAVDLSYHGAWRPKPEYWIWQWRDRNKEYNSLNSNRCTQAHRPGHTLHHHRRSFPGGIPPKGSHPHRSSEPPFRTKSLFYPSSHILGRMVGSPSKRLEANRRWNPVRPFTVLFDTPKNRIDRFHEKTIPQRDWVSSNKNQVQALVPFLHSSRQAILNTRSCFSKDFTRSKFSFRIKRSSKQPLDQEGIRGPSLWRKKPQWIQQKRSLT
jgi:hypothetical protein